MVADLPDIAWAADGRASSDVNCGICRIVIVGSERKLADQDVDLR
jgi:hypothetical protein